MQTSHEFNFIHQFFHNGFNPFKAYKRVQKAKSTIKNFPEKINQFQKNLGSNSFYNIVLKKDPQIYDVFVYTSTFIYQFTVEQINEKDFLNRTNPDLTVNPNHQVSSMKFKSFNIEDIKTTQNHQLMFDVDSILTDLPCQEEQYPTIEKLKIDLINFYEQLEKEQELFVLNSAFYSLIHEKIN